MKICKYCGEEFENGRTYSNHVRWKHKKKEIKCQYCNEVFSCGIEQHEKSCYLNPKNKRNCPVCNTIIKILYNKYCSRSCAGKINSIDRKVVLAPKKANCIICNAEILSIKKKKYCQTCLYERHKRRCIENEAYRKKVSFFCICTICNKSFINYFNPRKTCSKTCYKTLLQKNSRKNPHCGGETNFKRYKYKNILMDSSWEVELAKWLDHNNIKWIRSRKLLLWWTDKQGNKRRYYPDFYLPKYDIYLDPKNTYLQQKDQLKLKQVVKENNITLIYGSNEKIYNQLQNLSL